MSTSTGIEWTDTTWNPVVGCSMVSPGCAHCYAETMSKRIAGMARKDISLGKNPGRKEHYLHILNDKGRWNGSVKLVPEALVDPLHWKRPRRVFVNSMSDLFHEDVPFEFVDKVFAVMALCPQHSFQVLTKRPERMAEYLSEDRSVRVMRSARKRLGSCRAELPVLWNWPLPSVWLGTSVEDQQRADERIPHLLKCHAAVRFLSCEPLLGPVEFSNVSRRLDGVSQLGKPALSGTHWVIVGGESGPKARPMHPDWARSLRDQCKAAGVAFFFKQWGEYGAGSENMTTGEPVFRTLANKQQWINKAQTWVNGGICLDASGKRLRCGADFDVAAYPVTVMHRFGKKDAGRMLDGREWNEWPDLRVREMPGISG